MQALRTGKKEASLPPMERVAKEGKEGDKEMRSIWEVLERGEERRSVVVEPVQESHWKVEEFGGRRSRARRWG